MVAFEEACLGARFEYGTNVTSQPEWPAELNKLVNHPARYAGYSMLGHSEFSYRGEVKILNELLAIYGGVPLPELIVYLTPEFETDHPLQLQVLNRAKQVRAYVTVSIGSMAKLEELKIPKSVSVEAIPPAGVRVKPNGEVDDAEQKRVMGEIEAFVKQRRRAEKG